MNQTIHNAALLNQTGAAYLASNQPERAQKCFKTALEYVTHSGDGNMQDIPSSNALRQPLPASISGDSDDNYIYTKPFFFNPAASMTEEEIAPFGAVILFNLALSYHEQAKITGDSDLKVAMALYEKCLNLLRRHSNFDCSNIIIAALHNQAKICEELCHFAQAGQKFLLLSTLLEQDEIRTDTIEPDDLNAVCLNIYFFKFPTCAPVA